MAGYFVAAGLHRSGASSVHPLAAPAAATAAASTTCEPVRGANLSLLLLGLYLVPLGDGAMKACLPALGGDQFDPADPDEQRQEVSFYNWYTFAASTGGFVGLVFIVWVQNSKGWGVGFPICAAFVLLGLLVWAAAFPLYRNRLPTGSPITRILQRVTVCLEKAAVRTGNEAGAWSLCSVNQVEETKILLRMAPIFAAAVLGYIPMPLILTFTVQQGSTMNTKLGSLVTLVLYDRAIVPPLRRLTGYVGGVTHLQRIGVGFVATVMATAVAAVVETRRKSTAGIPLSVFWLTPQFFLIGIFDVTSFVGLLEFFCSEVSMGMKSIGGSIFYCILGVSAWLGSLLIQVTNRVTPRGGSGGWLDGANLNNGKLERFYVVLCIIEVVALLSYVFFARRYVYRNEQKVVTQGGTMCDTGSGADMI
uniref:Major facilitator superfamily (MFS) profile domain-containing protein n=1 Tax=Oryza glumipatula TaxID=40148 RepID=A0A0E0BHR4_9ORYZ